MWHLERIPSSENRFDGYSILDWKSIDFICKFIRNILSKFIFLSFWIEIKLLISQLSAINLVIPPATKPKAIRNKLRMIVQTNFKKKTESIVIFGMKMVINRGKLTYRVWKEKIIIHEFVRIPTKKMTFSWVERRKID